MILIGPSRAAFVISMTTVKRLRMKQTCSSLFSTTESSRSTRLQREPLNPPPRLVLQIDTPDDMYDLGALLSQIAVKRGDVMLLNGDLGAGKTSLARGFVQTLVGQEEETKVRQQQQQLRVTSPTYLLCNSYPIIMIPSSLNEDDTVINEAALSNYPQIVHHMDLYRLSGQEEDLLSLNLDHAFRQDVCLIEWPQRLGGRIPPERLELDLVIMDTTATICVDKKDRKREYQHQEEVDDNYDGYDGDEYQPRRVTLTPFGSEWEDRLEMLQTNGYVDDWIIDNDTISSSNDSKTML